MRLEWEWEGHREISDEEVAEARELGWDGKDAEHLVDILDLRLHTDVEYERYELIP